jgi:hypothetical protein
MSTLGAAGGICDFNSLAVGVQQSSMTFHKGPLGSGSPQLVIEARRLDGVSCLNKYLQYQLTGLDRIAS